MSEAEKLRITQLARTKSEVHKEVLKDAAQKLGAQMRTDALEQRAAGYIPGYVDGYEQCLRDHGLQK